MTSTACCQSILTGNSPLHLACPLALRPLELREAVPENDSLETSAMESEKKLVTHFDENNCRPSLDQSIDLELPPLSLSSEDEDSVLKSTGLNRILQ